MNSKHNVTLKILAGVKYMNKLNFEYITFLLLFIVSTILLTCQHAKSNSGSRDKPASTEQIIGEIGLQQLEMLDVVVLVQTGFNVGSGTIISCKENNDKNFEYLVLANAHQLDLLQENKIQLNITTFINENNLITQYTYNAHIICLDKQLDLVILSFQSDRKFKTAKVATKEMLSNIKVFDEVFAIGCQFGFPPGPTKGIISHILTMTGDNEKNFIIYVNTAQIVPGSSGGGLFKKHDNGYFLVGIPFRVARTSSGQIIPHMAQAISFIVANDFIENCNIDN